MFNGDSNGNNFESWIWVLEMSNVVGAVDEFISYFELGNSPNLQEKT